ncbi:MAG: NADH-quinone oxidoreductase subunit NuoN [Gammaproteobacteria bacterium]|nr:NADH-quinone oxidoreductase subunit NuoN [Gammaproteobacteria bacterium]NIR82704.1 NADH-quinone oxidoreductase subunit NuoN [Gammaproteobacteria bacterium]NIR89568.1 NADH-quinone oxidoreductase subunit NuoN [Gammaproteobacteria bacterium]NIU03864.1 NADH-quinone oxidoreductase subunit NuoN [Gammaproteobacteria bacterium]NIX85138.1 NADH-quinone oxidoreductase subunit NuoN [Gammaproteobacteria bacterium]
MTFTVDHLIALLPIIGVTLTSIVVMLVVAFVREHRLTAGLTLTGLAVSFVLLLAAGTVAPLQVTPLLVVDRYALFYTGLLLAATLAVAGLCYGYFEGRREQRDELYILLLTATLGGAVLVASSHFASFFLGLELVSVSLFALIAYPREHRPPLEAALKYLILSGVSSALLLFGMALMYAEMGTLEFARMSALLAGDTALRDAYLLAGLALVIAGVGFKLSLVPFHLWTPDVYQGAPAPVTAFLATVSKGAIFALLLRYFAQAGGYAYTPVLLALAVIAIASMLLGNLLALLQDNVKRILAYSSIAHLGYLLVAFLAGGPLAVESVSYYLAAYFVTTIGAFGILALVSSPTEARETERLEDYRGLFWRRPWLAGVFTLMLLSLAGIPLTMGFVAKFYVFAAGVDASLWLLVAILVVGSAIGLFYYLRVIVFLYMPQAETPAAPSAKAAPLAGPLVLAALTALLVWLGVYPEPIVEVIQGTAVGLI